MENKIVSEKSGGEKKETGTTWRIYACVQYGKGFETFWTFDEHSFNEEEENSLVNH